ncbi:hypothetical protein ENBRE01_3082 [Enteropsectra breve]|nr:hypothetical protein ENBRE01_3082 [Enteropsectra breve]
MLRIHGRSLLFSNIQSLYDLLVEFNVVPLTKPCEKCNDTMRLRIYCQNGKQRIIHRCTKKTYQSKSSICPTKLPLNDYVYLIWHIFHDLQYKQIDAYMDISKRSISKIRQLIRNAYQVYLNRHIVILGGIDNDVQCDETVLSRRGIVRNPTSTDDDRVDTVWILGCVDNNNNFFIKRLLNRRADTITNVLHEKIIPCSNFLTDGYPSYPQVAANLHLEHHVVNHSEGFITADGVHTNGIEGFWAHLKSQMRKQHGVARNNIDNWLIEYTFMRRFLMNATKTEKSTIFLEILKIMFN